MDIRHKIKQETLKSYNFKVSLWSCYPDLNWRPHPYQNPRTCFFLLFVDVSYCSFPVAAQWLRQFLLGSYSILLDIEILCFFMPVWVLYGFLSAPIPSDLIPTYEALRPRLDEAGPFFHACRYIPQNTSQPRRKAC